MGKYKPELGGFTRSDVERLVLELRVDGCTVEEVAKFLGCSNVEVALLEAFAIKHYKPEWATT